MQNFCHLHLHSQYSLLDGANKISEVVKKAKKLEQKAVAITDHGCMHGVLEFYSACKGEGIKPIIGCELYVSATSRFDKNPKDKGGGQTHHLTVLASSNQGYKNLCRLVTAGYLEGFYHRPRVDYELLAELNEGLIVLSGCMASELAKYTTRERIDGAEEYIRKYRNTFGERFYLEVQPHVFEEQQTHNKAVLELSKKLSLPTVATNDCHYLNADDHFAQEVLMCISTGKLITDDDRIKHDHSRLHFKTASEMLEGLPEFEEGLRNTGAIADLCDVSFDFNTFYLPKFKRETTFKRDTTVKSEAGNESEEEISLEDEFINSARLGLEERLIILREDDPTFNLEAVYYERLETELKLILKMGFSGYFLVVSDFIKWSKRNNIPVGPGRGSAAGSLVAWVMEITEVDPIPHKLIFERFLNPDRVSLPDIDVDFCIYGREKVLNYVTAKYGKDRVAQIATFGTLKAKAVIKDVGRALGIPYAETDRIAKLVPAPRQGFDYPLKEALQMEPKLKEYAEGEGKDFIELAMKLEGLTRHSSTHAAGVVIADRPIVEFLPLMKDKDNNVITQLTMSWVEKIGLVKFDFLGLKTLTVLKEAQNLIEKNYNKKINLTRLPLNDKLSYQILSEGRTTGVFQLESSGITDMVQRLKPSCFEDIVAILALYRPGPLDAGMVDHYINRKHNREKTIFLHPILEPILNETYGIILYQEQIMQIARELGGYTLGEADMLRRAMGKKKPEEMASHRKIFTDGAVARGVKKELATEIFDQMETFARYGFNKSHSAAYAMISYHTAYLKAHYPCEFMAALMTHEMEDTDKTLKNFAECRAMGLQLLPPEINSGLIGFNAIDGKVIFGLAALKGVGEKTVRGLIEEREKNGLFKGFVDFYTRMDSSLLNRKSLDSFIKSGAFDNFNYSRQHLLTKLELVSKVIESFKEELNSLVMGLFPIEPPTELSVLGKPGEIKDGLKQVRLSQEREALGFYLSGHPLEKFHDELKRLGVSSIDSLKEGNSRDNVMTAGVVTLLKLKNTKKGDRYASFVFEDELDTIETLVWPDVYKKIGDLLASEDPIIIKGKLDISEDRSVLIANEVQKIIHFRENKAKYVILNLDSKKVSESDLKTLQKVASKHPGDCELKIFLKTDKAKVQIKSGIRVSSSDGFSNEIESLFGEGVINFN